MKNYSLYAPVAGTDNSSGSRALEQKRPNLQSINEKKVQLAALKEKVQRGEISGSEVKIELQKIKAGQSSQPNTYNKNGRLDSNGHHQFEYTDAGKVKIRSGSDLRAYISSKIIS